MSTDVALAERAPARALNATPVALFAVIYLLAFLSTTVLHELAHACTSALLGGKPVLYHVFVRSQLTSGLAAAAVAAAGPLFSLVQGLVLLALRPVFAPRRPAVRLFWLWLSVHGLVNFCGYLLTTPLMRAGDLGKVAVLLELPPALRWGLFALGAAGVLAVGFGVLRPLLALAPAAQQVADARGRASVIFQIAIVPWLLGALASALISYPASHWISYVYDVLSGCFLIGTWRHAPRVSPPAVASEQWADVALWPWSLALSALVAVLVFVLRGGVPIGW